MGRPQVAANKKAVGQAVSLRPQHKEFLEKKLDEIERKTGFRPALSSLVQSILDAAMKGKAWKL